MQTDRDQSVSTIKMEILPLAHFEIGSSILIIALQNGAPRKLFNFWGKREIWYKGNF